MITSGQVRELHQAVVPDQQRTGTINPSSNICKKNAKLAACLAATAGISSLVTKAISNPAAVAAAFSTVASATAVVAGAVNVIDGVRTVAVTAMKSRKLSVVNASAKRMQGANQARTDSFNKLKKMYASAQARGGLQTAIGLTAVALGGLALLGLISNPYVLAAVGGTAALLFLGMQVHKFIQSRQIKAELKKFEATIQKNESGTASVAGSASNQPNSHVAPSPSESPATEIQNHKTGPFLSPDDIHKACRAAVWIYTNGNPPSLSDGLPIGLVGAGRHIWDPTKHQSRQGSSESVGQQPTTPRSQGNHDAAVEEVNATAGRTVLEWSSANKSAALGDQDPQGSGVSSPMANSNALDSVDSLDRVITQMQARRAENPLPNPYVIRINIDQSLESTSSSSGSNVTVDAADGISPADKSLKLAPAPVKPSWHSAQHVGNQG